MLISYASLVEGVRLRFFILNLWKAHVSLNFPFLIILNVRPILTLHVRFTFTLHAVIANKVACAISQ